MEMLEQMFENFNIIIMHLQGLESLKYAGVSRLTKDESAQYNIALLLVSSSRNLLFITPMNPLTSWTSHWHFIDKM